RRILNWLDVSADVADELKANRAAVAGTDRLAGDRRIERLARELRRIEQKTVELSLPREKEPNQLLQLGVAIRIHMLRVVVQKLVGERHLPQRRRPECRPHFASRGRLLHLSREHRSKRVAPGQAVQIGEEEI